MCMECLDTLSFSYESSRLLRVLTLSTSQLPADLRGSRGLEVVKNTLHAAHSQLRNEALPNNFPTKEKRCYIVHTAHFDWPEAQDDLLIHSERLTFCGRKQNS
jgi:hypothetical protein